MPMSTCVLTPCKPTSPERLASQPGEARLKCHWSSVIIGGGAVSFGASSTGPATRPPTDAATAHAKKNSFVLTGSILWSRKRKSRKINRSLVPHDLGTLQAKSGHQTLLIEGEGIDAAMQGVGGQAPGHTLVHDDNAGPSANLPAARVVYPVHRVLFHQEEGVTELLNAGLQAIGGGYGSVAAARPAVHEENSLPSLRAKDEASFDYIRKNKNGHCSRFTFGGRRILRHELLQSATGVGGQIVGECCVSAK